MSPGPGEVRWDGTAVGGGPVPTGRYTFKFAGQASAAQAGDSQAFTVYDALFPIRGQHRVGASASNGFGAGHHG